ncbi:MAG: hypothetical protein ABI178_09115 [Rhodanobacter sp.]
MLLLTDRLVPPRDNSATASTTAASSPIASTAKALPHPIAVLAFDDLSAAHDQKNFSEGIAEQILNALTRVKALTVIGRSSSFPFQARTPARNTLVFGSVRRARPFGPKPGRRKDVKTRSKHSFEADALEIRR